MAAVPNPEHTEGMEKTPNTYSYGGVEFTLPTAYELRMASEDYDRNHVLSEGQEALRDLNAHLERESTGYSVKA
jgi:hypothetical protein